MEKKHTPAPADRYPGATIDTADRDKTTPKLEKERTKTLNDNPRDNN